MEPSPSTQTIDTVIAQAWAWAREQHNLTEEHSLDSISELLRKFAADADEGVATDGLEPWLTVATLGANWLCYMHTIWSLGSFGDKMLPTGPTRAPWSLIAAACNNAVAVVTLVRRVLDLPARAATRVLAESSLLAIAVCDDATLAELYLAPNNEEEVQRFWRQHASPGKLHARIIEIEKKLGMTAEDIGPFKGWRNDVFAIMSEAVHPSFVSCVMGILPPDPKTELMRYAPCGGISGASVYTLKSAATLMWYFANLGWLKLTTPGDSSPAHFPIDEDAGPHRSCLALKDTFLIVSGLALRADDPAEQARERQRSD